jgi:hypothetical protein
MNSTHSLKCNTLTDVREITHMGETGLSMSASVHRTDLLIPHTLPTSVHRTVMHAIKDTTNLKLICPAQQLQFESQRHLGCGNTHLVSKSEKSRQLGRHKHKWEDERKFRLGGNGLRLRTGTTDGIL